MEIVSKKGYTLIELMLAVCILAILAAVATLGVNTMIAKARDAQTIGSLAILRATIALYHVDTEGRFPEFAPGIINAGYGTTLQDALVPKYIDKIPVAYLDGNNHPVTNSVCDVWNMTGSCEDQGSNYGAGWMYDANHFDIGVYPSSGWGSIKLACAHTNVHGRNWSTY